MLNTLLGPLTGGRQCSLKLARNESVLATLGNHLQLDPHLDLFPQFLRRIFRKQAPGEDVPLVSIRSVVNSPLGGPSDPALPPCPEEFIPGTHGVKESFFFLLSQRVSKDRKAWVKLAVDGSGASIKALLVARQEGFLEECLGHLVRRVVRPLDRVTNELVKLGPQTLFLLCEICCPPPSVFPPALG